MSSKFKYLLPSLAQVLFVVVLLHLSFNIGQRLLMDCDTAFHIKAGEYMLQTRSIPNYDPFSLYSPPMPWPTHEWLSDVIMALIDRIGGLSAVVAFFIFIISISYSLLFRVLRANKGNIYIDIALIVFVLISSQMHWLARPHMFSLLFLILWYSILESFHTNRNNLLYLLPPLMLVWVNLHGGFIIGFVTIIVYVLYYLLKWYQRGAAEDESHKKKLKYLSLATMASLVVSLINPKGFHTLLFPFDVVSNHLIMDNYGEFLSPDFHQSPFFPFKYFLLFTIACLGISRTNLNLVELVLVLVFTNMSLFSARYIPLFAVVVAPILSRHGSIILDQAKNGVAQVIINRAKVQESLDDSAKGYVWPIIAILVVTISVADHRIRFEFDQKIKPVAAVEFLKKEQLHGNMFNNDEFGDYIIYSAFPQYKVFFDSRADIYGNEKLKDYLKVMSLKPDLENVFDKYNINWIIYNKDSALSLYLNHEKRWKLIYTDNVANIYIKNVAQNESLIKKYVNCTAAMPDNVLK